MPTYTFKNKKTDKEWTEFMHLSECTKFLEDNPDVDIVVTPRAIVSGIDGHLRPDGGWKDILKTLNKKHPSVKTFD